MFDPSRDEARRFFFETWRKHRAGVPLEGLERTLIAVLLLHPEYHEMLEQPDRFTDRDWSPESGETNPFLHLSLHLAVEEQVSIDQPPGIRAAVETLTRKHGSDHDARHAVIECLGEVVWHAQRHGTPFDAKLYFECLERQGGVER